MKNEEQKLQAECTQWFQNTYPHLRKMCFAVHNNPKNALHGAQLKAIGLRSGVSDVVLVIPGGKVIWLEFKAQKGVLGKEQLEFKHELGLLGGHEYHVVKSFLEFKQIIFGSVK